MYQQFQTGFVYSYYSNPTIDELLKKEAATANREERLGVLKQMQTEFDKNPPYVPLYQPEDYYAASKKLSGFTPRASQFLDLKTFKLS
jgi:peptide/nickel transport system substrate-binding protein